MRNDGRRPDGMSLISWKSGKCLEWDATYSDMLALAPFYINISTRTAGKVANVAETKENQNTANSQRIKSLSQSLWRQWAPEAKSFIKDFGDVLTTIAGLAGE